VPLPFELLPFEPLELPLFEPLLVLPLVVPLPRPLPNVGPNAEAPPGRPKNSVTSSEPTRAVVTAQFAPVSAAPLCPGVSLPVLVDCALARPALNPSAVHRLAAPAILTNCVP
jgi:hypothetical protein